MTDRSRRRRRLSLSPLRTEGTTATVLRRMPTPMADVLALAAVVLIGPADLVGVVYAVGVLLVLAVDGHYRPRVCPRVSDQVPRIVVAATLPLVGMAPWVPVPGAPLIVGTSVLLIATLRTVARGALKRAYCSGLLRQRVLILGSGATARQVTELLNHHPELGMVPTGLVDDPRMVCTPRDPTVVRAVVRRRRIKQVLACPPSAEADTLVASLRALRPLGVTVWLVPTPYQLGVDVPRSTVDELWGVPLLRLRGGRCLRGNRVAKRAFDLAVGSVLVVLTAPMLAALAIGTRLHTGRALFRQIRLTESQAMTDVVKLRTVPEESDRWSVSPGQCSALGRWLRATHLDELPQLFNVLRGDMSLVGPRPERPYYAMRFARDIPEYADRHRVPGGITGWAQVHGLHGDTSIADRVRFDNQYIENWSPWLDLVIVVRTVGMVLRTIVGELAGKDNNARLTSDHRARGRRCRATTAVDPATHSARRRCGFALQPRRGRADDRFGRRAGT